MNEKGTGTPEPWASRERTAGQAKGERKRAVEAGREQATLLPLSGFCILRTRRKENKLCP